MNRLVGPALAGTLRYEAVMAARRRVLWAGTLPLVVLSLLMAATEPSLTGLRQTSAQIGAWTVLINLVTTLGVAVVLVDRFARACRRGLPELLDATGAGTALRLVGALVGSLTVALVPVAVAMLGVGVAFAVSRNDATALAWAVLGFVVIIVPAALVAAAFAATLGLALPVPLARVMVLGIWIWATVWNSAIIPVPSISGTVLSPLGDYVAHGWFGAPTFKPISSSLLSPTMTATSAAMSVVALVAVSAVLLVTARVLRAARG